MTIRTHGLGRMVSEFCRIAEVSRAGYYDWLKAADNRILLEESDYKDYELILKIFEAKKEKSRCQDIEDGYGKRSLSSDESQENPQIDEQV